MKTIVITGATGYLGQALIPMLLEYKPESIRLLGRNELKLSQIQRQYGDLYKNQQFRPMICDIRDRERVFSCLKDADLVIHAAALKRLEVCNYNPQEAIKTNVLGSMNVMDACLNVGVKKAVFISTDKAVEPTNLYGATKKVMEEMVLQRSIMLGNNLPKMTIVRYGNVVGSTGAVIPYFIQLAKEGKALPITADTMSRFIIAKKDAVDTVKTAIESNASICLPSKLKAVYIASAAKWINDYLGNEAGTYEIGMFAGEKLMECLAPVVYSDFPEYQLTQAEFIKLLIEEGLL